MTGIEKGILGEPLDKTSHFVCVREPGESRRIIAARWICRDDFPPQEEFYKSLVEIRKRLAQKYGPEHIIDIGGVGFLHTVGSWNDELTVGGFDQPELINDYYSNFCLLNSKFLYD